jgi:hypothetical protein
MRSRIIHSPVEVAGTVPCPNPLPEGEGIVPSPLAGEG